MAKTARKEVVDVAALLARPTISPEELYESGLLKLGRNLIYEGCRNGDIESFRVGPKLIRIPTAPLRRKLGIGEPA